MAESSHGSPGRVFISYRREDTADGAAWLYDRLAKRFGDDRVFKDVDSIAPGDDFTQVITDAVCSCDVLLVLIGNRWLAALDTKRKGRIATRNRRIDDWVRFEIETAFAHNVRVIPVLMGAKMPRTGDLPASLAMLARCQAFELSPNRVRELLRILEDALSPAGPQPTAPRVKRTLDCQAPGPVSAVAFSHDGQLLASGCDDGRVRVFGLVNGRQPSTMDTFAAHAGTVFSVAFSPRYWLLASAGMDEAVRVWNPSSRTIPRVLKGHREPVFSVAFSPDGRLLASGGSEKIVVLWDPETGERRRTLRGDHSVWTLAFSPDGRQLASGGGDGKIELWDLATGKRMHILGAHDGVKAVAFSPDGRLLASVGSSDRTVRLWGPATGAQLRTLITDHTFHGSVAFSPDARLLAASGDEKVRLWDPATGRQLRPLAADHGVHSVVFSPAGWLAGGPVGWLLAGAGGENMTQLWYLAPPDG